MAEAIRHRLVPGEGHDAHRRVADLLAALPDPPASEIADHWRAVDDHLQEMTWRLVAARSAERRFARGEAYPEWMRVLELWDAPGVQIDGLDATLGDVHTQTIETSISAGAEVGVVRHHVEAAMAADLSEQGRAEVLLRAGDLECAFGDPEAGLRLIDEAVAINDHFPPTADAGHILEVRALIRRSLGQHDAVSADVEHGLEVADAVGDTALRRMMLGLKAWTLAGKGFFGEAERLARQARSLEPAADDPYVRSAWLNSRPRSFW